MKKLLKDRRINLITTFSPRMYNEYIWEYLKSWEKFLDSNIRVTLYVDDTEKKYGDRFTVLELEKSVPDLIEFKKRNSQYIATNFKVDAVRFSHKSYVICHAGLTSTEEILIWLDADVMMFRPIDREYLMNFIPYNRFTSYLGRRKFTETGFLAFNLTQQYSRDFFIRWKEFYDNDYVMTDLQHKTDCHVFDAVRLEFSEDNRITTYDLTVEKGNGGKHAFESVFGENMSHTKGVNPFQLYQSR